MLLVIVSFNAVPLVAATLWDLLADAEIVPLTVSWALMIRSDAPPGWSSVGRAIVGVMTLKAVAKATAYLLKPSIVVEIKNDWQGCSRKKDLLFTIKSNQKTKDVSNTLNSKMNEWCKPKE